ncbi:hypothetical protein S83_017985 [Arachis hypogaea]
MMKGLLWLNVVEKYLLLTWTTVEKFFRVANGEGLPLAVKELGICDLYPQDLLGEIKDFVVCFDGFGEIL